MSEQLGRQAGGRGRGRTQSTVPVVPPPGVVAAPPTAANPATGRLGAGAAPADGRRGVDGRRGADGRRATDGDASQKSPPHGTKGNSGSPSEGGSPPAEKLLELEMMSLALRPGVGTIGRKYKVATNHFEMRLTKSLQVYHYHVEVTHPKIKLTRDDNRPILWNCFTANSVDLGLMDRGDFYKLAYDGVSNLYSLNPLKMEEDNSRRFQFDSIVMKSDRPQKIGILIQLVGPELIDVRLINSSDMKKNLTPIQVLDIIIRQYRSNPTVDFGRSFYPFRNSVYMIPGMPGVPGGYHLGGGREIWKGLFTSAHLGQNHKPLVNMDVAHTVFYKWSTGEANGNGGLPYTAIHFLCDVLNESEGRQTYDIRQINAQTKLPASLCQIFEREAKGKRVCISYNKPGSSNPSREYRILGVDKPSVEITFADRDGNENSVASYFEKTYGPLRFPLMPTLKVGSKAKPIHLPIEHCHLAKNQRVPKKLTENQTSQMIRQVCMPPADRKHSIEQMVKSARFNEDPFLRNFGIELSPNMMMVDSRVLPPPNLAYAQNAVSQPRDGVWRTNNMRFYVPSEMKGLAVIAFSNPAPPQNTNGVIGDLLRTCGQFGMTVPAMNQVFFHMEQSSGSQRVENALTAVCKSFAGNKLTLSLIIVLLPAKGSPLYADVKRIAEVQMGVMTQCLVHKTLTKFSPDTAANIAFKINMKLGGINCILQTKEVAAGCLKAVPTLVLGIDVTHPGPLEKKSPSIASVVGSMDSNYMRFAASIKVQKQRREHLVYLADPVSERLLAFYRETKKKPERIIVYRDGVSDGEFKAVLHEELRGIREACTKIDPNFKPNITFIVVQKRHHTRMFPAVPNDGCGKHKNVFPGMVVDTNVVFHEDFCFYLCSHAGIQGTSRPTRYNVIHDDNKFSSDEVQLMTYYLCHCFSRCTRAVSIPGPVYYAHLACARARDHLKAIVGEALSDSASSRSGDQGQGSSIPEDDLIRGTRVQETIAKEMYFT